MTTFNIGHKNEQLCVDCSEDENREFERVIAEQDQRIREHRQSNAIAIMR